MGILENILNRINRIPKVFWPIITILITVISVIILAIYIIPFFINAEETGNAIGSTAGRFVGNAIGSYTGITEGLSEGYANGKSEGKSAKDIETEVANMIQSSGSLVVLSAKVQFKDYMNYSDKYAAIYMFRGDATFSIDLTKTTVTTDQDGKVVIMIPIPSVNITLNDEETDIIAEWQKKYFNGSSEDGFDAFLNSEKMLKEKSLEQIQDYESLVFSAKESAKTQIESLASNICGYTPEVKFTEA